MGRKRLSKYDIMRDESLTPKEKYHKYMRTLEWQDIRILVLMRDGNKCKCCGRTEKENGAELTVHHSTYKHLFNELKHLSDLITLCKYCHKGIHSVPSNKPKFKMSLEKADKAIKLDIQENEEDTLESE